MHTENVYFVCCALRRTNPVYGGFQLRNRRGKRGWQNGSCAVFRVRFAHFHNRVFSAHCGISAAAVHMQIDKSGGKVLPAAVNHFCRVRHSNVFGDFSNFAVFHRNLGRKNFSFADNLHIFKNQHNVKHLALINSLSNRQFRRCP